MSANNLHPAGAPQPSPLPNLATAPLPRPAKVQVRHLDRIAVVYVRQSTHQQVFENTESTQRQYALATRAADLGWSPDRVLVIDEDQGRSGATAEGRLGFQRLLAEVALDHVGLILDDWSIMPILADALQDAGCENDDVLDHCRGAVPHVRGDWVLDSLLGLN